MIRPLTLITAILFVLSGAYLFAVKHRSQMLDNDIAATTQATRLDEQRIVVLQAQWALEVDPSRLAQLSAQFTTLQPMKPSQLITLTALDSVLPPPGSAVPAGNPAGEIPVITGTAAAQPAAPPPAKLAAQPAPIAPPAKLAAAPPPGLQNVEALLRTLPAPHHPRRATHEVAETRPLYTPGAQLVAVRDLNPPAPGPAPQDGGSMLGMAQAMAPGGSSN